MPFAGFKDFDECKKEMMKKYKKEEIANKVCGKLQALHEKKHELSEIHEQILSDRKWLQEASKRLKEGTLTVS